MRAFIRRLPYRSEHTRREGFVTVDGETRLYQGLTGEIIEVSPADLAYLETTIIEELL